MTTAVDPSASLVPQEENHHDNVMTSDENVKTTTTPAIVTPTKTLAHDGCSVVHPVVTPDHHHDPSGSESEDDSGDTCSETSETSSSNHNQEAEDILFGKQPKAKVEEENEEEEEPNTALEEELKPVAKNVVEDDAEKEERDEEEETEREDKDDEPEAAATTKEAPVVPGARKEETFEIEKPEEEQKPECITSATSSTAPTTVEPLPSPPRRTSRVSLTAASFDRPTTAPRPSTTPVAGTGLSELSKQLRVLQAKNQYLQSEMDRCQRQLKIMSESKGVSVVDVLASLESACAAEAHAELQSKITSLEAQLEAMKHSKTPPRGGAAGNKATQLQHESLKQQIVSLQLQVGEQEELEANFRQETKALYDKVNLHQSKAITLEATCAQQTTRLEAEQARSAALEAEVAALRGERDALKEKQRRTMGFLFNRPNLMENLLPESKKDTNTESVEGTTASNKPTDFSASLLPNDSNSNQNGPNNNANKVEPDAKMPKSYGFVPSTNLPADRPTLARNNSDPALLVRADKKASRPTLSRTYSDPQMWNQDGDNKVPRSYVSSMLPRYSSSSRQWTYDNAMDNTGRSTLYVQQSARNIELEALCRHQQQTIQDLQQDQSRDQAMWERLEQERDAAKSRRNAVEQQINTLELDLRLEKEQAESLRSQLERREEEFSLKKEQLESRLQVHKERTVDVEGQLSSLYVAFELLQEDRSEEQTEQAELKSRLLDADAMVAKQISDKAITTGDDRFARQISERDMVQDEDASVVSSVTSITYRTNKNDEGAKLRKGAGLLAPRRSSVRSLLSGSRRASTTSAGLPPTGSSKQQRRSSTGSAMSAKSNAPPAPGTTVYKGYLLLQPPKEKKLLRGLKPAAWKRRYVVLKRFDGPNDVGSYCLWYGDAPNGSVKGTIPHMIRGLSKVSFDDQSMASSTQKKPNSFVLSINPTDANAPVVHLAASSSSELEPWKTVMQAALGVDFSMLSPDEQHRARVLMENAASQNYRYA